MSVVSQVWRRAAIVGSMVLKLVLLACGPFAQFSPGGDNAPYDSNPIVFDDLPAGDPRAIAVNFAIAQDGKPYTQYPAGPVNLWCGVGGGGCTRNGPDCFDCSGLTGAAYKQAGITLGPTTYYQINDGISVPCSSADLNGAATTCWQPGDLALFLDSSGPYHVAMYTYDGMFAEALNCDEGVLFWERPPSSMRNTVARRIVGPDGQPYATHADPLRTLLLAQRSTP